jgi:hypothetical protein
MCSNDKLYPCLSLFIHILGKVFHIALSPLILERISQVANTGAIVWGARLQETLERAALGLSS